MVESFGVRVAISVADANAIDAVRNSLVSALPGCVFVDPSVEAKYRFSVEPAGADLYRVTTGDEEIRLAPPERAFEILASRVRLTIAEFSERFVFLHSGAVGWKGRAIVLPGSSLSGKTTLTAELVKLGAEYFSDEFAVIDSEGSVHPFPKTLSMRGIIDDFRQVELSVESIGGRAADKSLPAGLVLFSKFKKDAVWRPRRLSPAKGLMSLIADTLPIRTSPAFTLAVLNRVAANADFLRSNRGDAKEAAEKLLVFLETKLGWQ